MPHGRYAASLNKATLIPEPLTPHCQLPVPHGRYAASLYKVCGPHLAALYGTHAAFAEVSEGGPNHYFIPPSAVPYKWELGGPSHEACAGVAALPQYLAAIAGL